MDRDTIGVYESRAGEWHDQRRPDHDSARAFGAAVSSADRTGPTVDLGCGPGWFSGDLGPRAIALDAAAAMLALVPAHAPGVPRVQADLAHLPFRSGALGAAWASKSYVHLPRADIPLALHDLHRALAVDSPVAIVLFGGDAEFESFGDDEFAGRQFSLWPHDLLVDVIAGAGFEVDHIDTRERSHDTPYIEIRARRARTLADTVCRGMRLLVCGLNPSLYASDVGVGFARPGNRFWPAAMAAGIVSVDRDPVHALAHHGIGMTDLVKRSSPRADDLTAHEYRAGLGRLERLAAWLEPRAICFVGLAGWRAATDRHAVAGPQQRRVGGRPVYVMPNTSGVNASSSLADLTAHLRAADTLSI